MADRRGEEQLMISYLLGELSGEEQTDFELRYFSSPALLEELSAVEDDLIDEYVRGELSSHHAAQIESRLLFSEELRQRVASARALAQVAPRLAGSSASDQTPVIARQAVKNRWRLRLPAFLRASSGARKFAFTLGVLALLLLGSTWFIYRSLRKPVEVARRQNVEEAKPTPAPQTPVNQNRPTETATTSPSPTNEEQQNGQRKQSANQDLSQPNRNQTPEPPHTLPPRSETFVAVITPGALRGEGGVRKLAVPQTASLLRLKLQLDSADEGYKSYRAELSADSSGQSAAVKGAMTARGATGRKYLTLDVPLKSLIAGEYTLRLEGQSDDRSLEKIEVYHLSILKK